MDKLFLIDGMSLVFRAYHAMFRSELSTPAGEPSGAVFGFTNILTSLLEKEDPENIAVIFDTSEPTFRHKIYPEYKANRDAFPEDLVPQLKNIKKLLDLLSIPRAEFPGFEADDIIGTLAKQASKENIPVYCMTSDKDFLQLVDDHIHILKPATKGGELEVLSYEGVKDKFGVHPSKVIEVMALIGDSSDNIPGVKGVGEKTAIPLIQEYGSLEKLYENIDAITRKAVKTKLENDKEKAFLSRTLVTIDTKVPVDFSLNYCTRKVPDYDALDKFFAEMGFNNIRKKWREKAGMGIFTGASEITGPKSTDIEVVKKEEAHKTISEIQKEYIFVDSIEKLREAVSNLASRELLSFDLETSSLDRDSCTIVGIALSSEEGRAYYVPVDERLDEYPIESKPEAPEQDSLFSSLTDDESNSSQKPFKSSLPTNAVLDILKPLLENRDIGKCGQNCKFDTYILLRYGIETAPVVFDSMIASYLLDPDSKHNLDALSESRLDYTPVSIKSLIGEKKSEQKSMRDLEPASISDYACEDADLALKLRNILYPELEKESLLGLAEKVEFPLIEVLTRMESKGIAINEAALADLSEKISVKTAILTLKIYEEAGTEFNIDSPKQLGHVMFEKLMIPSVKKVKTGYSTDVEVLTQLAPLYPIADYMLEYRQLVKLKSTYVDTLPKLINRKSGRIHTTYNQTVASTGRLSSTDPNLQNIPIRTELGKEIRRAFVPASKDNVIFSADYSQVELRIMAHYCNDEQLIRAFKNGLDIHSATAAVLNNIPIEEVDQDMRRIAKTVNFGIMYGLGPFGLSQRLGLTRTHSKEIIQNYFEKYPGIRKYIDMTIERTREKGYSETLLGRRRFFHNINSQNHNLRTAAERGAINMPIQGTASDMMKLAMISVDKEMRKLKMRSLMMLQVHDELVFEAPKDEVNELQAMVVEKMQSALPLGEVPVIVDTGTGDNWFEAH